MEKVKIKSILGPILFVFFLILASILGLVHRRLPSDYSFIYSLTYALSIGIYISLFIAWTVSVYNRIMKSRARTYLMLIGVNIVLWVSIRSVKWIAFRGLVFEDRLSWYMYYIPMIMIPLLLFFTALCIGKNENYRINKKWNLLFIPAVLLILLVLTNDLHFLVFSDLDLAIHMYGRDYTHNIGYFMVAIFLFSLMILSVALIIKKFRYSITTRKASRLPLLVIACIILYTILYVAYPSYGIGYYFMDTTIFGCTAMVAFWEACIRTGLVQSNRHHKDFFEMATTNAQLLTHTGKVVYTSTNALPLTNDIFEKLEENKSVDYDSNTIIHLSPIKGGYVSWSTDVSDIKKAISQLEFLNKALHEQVNLLTLENEHRKESTRMKKLNELENILRTEALPYSEKIKNTMMASENASLDDMKQLLFETSITSAYLKRKVNLILIAQTEKSISTDEIHWAFSEMFQQLRFYDKTCALNISKQFNMNLATAILCFDLFRAVIEDVVYDFEIIYLTLRQEESQIVFSMEMSGIQQIDSSELRNFDHQKLATLGGKLNFTRDDGNYHISLSISK